MTDAPVVQALGVGGIFFRARDPEALAAWYEATLGIAGPTSAAPWRSEDGVTVFAPFESDTDYFGPSGQWAMVNFRVADLDTAVAALQAARIPLARPVEEMEGVGRFAWVADPEGNRIELWEPAAQKP